MRGGMSDSSIDTRKVSFSLFLESAVQCGGDFSGFCPVNAGVRQCCVLAASLFNPSVECVLGKIMNQSRCGTSREYQGH